MKLASNLFVPEALHHNFIPVQNPPRNLRKHLECFVDNFKSKISKLLTFSGWTFYDTFVPRVGGTHYVQHAELYVLFGHPVTSAAAPLQNLISPSLTLQISLTYPQKRIHKVLTKQAEQCWYKLSDPKVWGRQGLSRKHQIHGQLVQASPLRFPSYFSKTEPKTGITEVLLMLVALGVRWERGRRPWV